MLSISLFLLQSIKSPVHYLKYPEHYQGESEQGAKIIVIKLSPLIPLLGEDIEEGITFCHLNH